MYTLFLLTVLAFSSVSGNSTIIPKLNPDCKQCVGNDTILVYIKALSDSFNYTVHQLWDFTGHLPTMMYIVGTKNSTVSVTWDGNKPQDIVARDSFYSFSMVLNNLLEYNDTNPDKVSFDYRYPHREISLHDVKWKLDKGILTSDIAKVRVRGDLSWERHKMNGTIDMKLVLVPFEGRALSLPRLYHSVNTTQVDVSLERLAVTPRYSAPRLALRYVIVSQDGSRGELRYKEERSIDDEYTPGVFETINLMTPGGASVAGGFVQFRPVAYAEPERDVENSVTAYVGYNRTDIPRDCLVEKYYAKFDREDVFASEVVASFGQAGDGFYTKTNYTVWTYSVGYGTPPAEYASAFLISMLVLGVTTPFVALFLSCCISSRMLRRNRPSLLIEDA